MPDELSRFSSDELRLLLDALEQLGREVGHLPYGHPARLVDINTLSKAVRSNTLAKVGRDDAESDLEVTIGAQAYGLQLDRPHLSHDQAESIVRSRYVKVGKLMRTAIETPQTGED